MLAIVAVWVDWAADDAALVFANNKVATHEAIAAAVRLEPRIEDVRGRGRAPVERLVPRAPELAGRTASAT